jgi:hypothetical protein
MIVLVATLVPIHAIAVDMQNVPYARDGNNTEAAAAAGNNIYLGLLPDQRIALLYIPWPYAASVDHQVVNGIYRGLARNDARAAYIRDSFRLLEQEAVVSIEPYAVIGEEIVFECSALAPCRIRIHNGYVEMVRPGIINEHITRYDPLPSG